MTHGNPEQERAERAVEFCRNNRGSTAGLAATFAAEEVALAVAAETERCAKIAESAIGATRHEIAEEIRGRR